MASAIQQQLDNLDALILQTQARLLELDNPTADQAAATTFSVGGQTFSWNEYRQSLAGLLKGYQDLRAQTIQQLWGGETVYGVVR